MDLKYLLCEPVSKLAVKANEQAAALMHQTNQQQNHDWHSITMYPTVITKQQDWNQQQLLTSSPKSVCSSLSTCSSTSSNSSSEDYVATPGRSNSFSSLRAPIPQYHHQHQQEQSRRRTASDVSLTRHHMFIYSHPNRRPRSESAGNTSNVQTRTPWTPFEDHLLQQGYDQGLSWAMISSTYLPHRSRGCCWGRFKTLQNKNMVDPNHTHMRHFRRPWKAIDFSNNSKKQQQHGI
ncbi:Homeodomain-like DNA binding domain-containing transcription factor [Mucor lusitanicus]|jgi:hypothetical protein|uniref:Homeodomain-like DNA binding domain-containing transcription factor n=2 Tax=Mucor circinelloides f. lusitanicus TaxID=29924 RepID=A0A168KG72_MUCCL|nr:Homeodomain-like DNA binding domain-containing transcription factor [Mucor lusitanicus]OAD02361.1 Homeodomain-like DNA binding domain-containing transcription factor [Mucor lusitanicus CBS 277.49]